MRNLKPYFWIENSPMSYVEKLLFRMSALLPRKMRLKLPLLLGLSALGAYLNIVTAAFLFFHDYRELDELSWFDFAQPARWYRRSIAQGDHAFLTAQHHLRRREFLQALAFARSGLAHSPQNADGRVLLAELLAASGRFSAAHDVLFDGLVYHRADARYLGRLFAFLSLRQDDAATIALAHELLSEKSVSDSVLKVAAFAAAKASYLRGDLETAAEFFRRDPALPMTRDGRLLSAKIDLDRGLGEIALPRLRALASDFPHDSEIHATLLHYLQDAGRADDARRTSLAFQLAHPDLPAPRIELLNAYAQKGDTAQIARDSEAFMRDFQNDNPALLLLSDFAANTGNVSLAHRLVTLARDRNLPWEPHALLAVEAALVARKFHAAQTSIDALLRENPRWPEGYRAVLDGFQSVVSFALGDTEASRLFLGKFLSQPSSRAHNLLALANRFAALGAEEQAHQIVTRAVAIDPSHQAALTRLVELDLNLNRIDQSPEHLRSLLAMRRPSPDVLRVARYKLGSDLFLFSPDRGPVLAAVSRALDKERRPTAPL